MAEAPVRSTASGATTGSGGPAQGTGSGDPARPAGPRPKGAKRRGPPRDLPHIGWREWVTLPELGIEHIKVKVDTGARTSSLHAFHIRRLTRGGEPWVRFEVHPDQRSSGTSITVEARVIDERSVRPSTGRAAIRPVIQTLVRLGKREWLIEVTLVRRDMMGFRMLLGRQAIRHRCLVDPGRSFLAGKPPKLPPKLEGRDRAEQPSSTSRSKEDS